MLFRIFFRTASNANITVIRTILHPLAPKSKCWCSLKVHSSCFKLHSVPFRLGLTGSRNQSVWILICMEYIVLIPWFPRVIVFPSFCSTFWGCFVKVFLKNMFAWKLKINMFYRKFCTIAINRNISKKLLGENIR